MNPQLLVGALIALAGYAVLGTHHGVTVYRREGAQVIDLAAEGEIDAPPSRVRDVLIDYARHASYVKGVAESRVLDRGDGWLVVHQRLGLPLISDRDYTLRVEWGQAGSVMWTRFSTANDRGPPPAPGVVRVELHEGGWRLEPIDGGRRTRAHYEFRLDLAGSLPGWLGRSRAGDDIPALFESIRKQAR